MPLCVPWDVVQIERKFSAPHHLCVASDSLELRLWATPGAASGGRERLEAPGCGQACGSPGDL